MLLFGAAAHVLLAVTVAVASPLEVLESSFRRIDSSAPVSAGRAFQNGPRAPYEILEQSFKFKDQVTRNPTAFTSAVRSRIAENEEQYEIARKLMSPQRPSSRRTTNAPFALETRTTKPTKRLVRTSTTKQPSETTPIVVRLKKTPTKPPPSPSSSQTTPILLRSTSISRAAPTTSSPVQILETSSQPINSKRPESAQNSHLTKSKLRPAAPRRLVDSMRPIRLQSHIIIPTSAKQNRPTFLSGTMMINANKDLVPTSFPDPDAVKSIRDIVKHLDYDPYLKSKFNTPPSISPTSPPDVAPVTLPKLRTSLPVLKITPMPADSKTNEATSTERPKFAEVEKSDSDTRKPVTLGYSSSSGAKIQFEEVHPGEVNILRIPISISNRERNSEKNKEKSQSQTWQLTPTGSENPTRYIIHKKPVETSLLSSLSLKQKPQSDPVSLSQKFPALIQAVKDSMESHATTEFPAGIPEHSKYSNFEAGSQNPKSSTHNQHYPSAPVQGLKTSSVSDSNSEFSVQSSEIKKHSIRTIFGEENSSKFGGNKNSAGKIQSERKTSVRQKEKLLNDVFDSQEKLPEKINILEDMSPTGIITYYEKLKHDIYDILNQLQENQQLEAHKLVSEDEFETQEDEQPSKTKPKLNYYYGEEEEEEEKQPPKIDIDKVLNIMRNFKARTSAEEVPESTMHEIAESIIKYINEKEQQSPTAPSYENNDYSHRKRHPTYGAPSYGSIPSEYDYHYVYYDDFGNEYLPENSNLFNKNKIISPSDEFTQAFLAKHTSKLSAMLTEVLQNAANNKATIINPLEFLTSDLERESTTTTASPTIPPQVNAIFTPFNQLPLSERYPSSTTTPLPAKVETTSTTSYPTTTEELSITEPTTTTEVPTSEAPKTTTTSIPETTRAPPKDSLFADTQKRQTATTSASNKRPSSSASGSGTRWTSIGPSSSPNRRKNKISHQSNQLFEQRRPQSTNLKVKYDYDDSNEVKEFGNPGAGSKVLPHPGAGNTALETLAGAGAVALMAYGISYALPLAAPLVLRRSGSSRETPISRLMNWLDISRSDDKKKRRKGVKKIYKNTLGYPRITMRNSTVIEPLNYDDYDDDYHTDYYEFGKTGQKRPAYDDYDSDFEDIPTRYRNDFKDTIPYEDSHYPFPSKFNHMAKLDSSSTADKKVEERKSDIHSPAKHVGSDFFSFGYDPTDGTIGDDPPNESAVFGKVTYEYDFTNTHINPEVVGADVRSDYYALPGGQNEMTSKGEIPARGTHPHGSPLRAGVPIPPRSDRKSKPAQSSNFLSHIFGNMFNRRSNTENVQPPKVHRRAPPNSGPIRGSRIPPFGQPRTLVMSSENPNFNYRSVEENRVPARGLPIHFSHSVVPRIPPGTRPRIDGELFSKEKVNRRDDIAVGGGGAVLSSELPKSGGGGISLPLLSTSSVNTRSQNPQFPSYVSLEQVNRLAEEEMQGVVRGYNRRHDVPWPPPPERSQIIDDKPDMTGAGSKVYLFDETDLEQGYHLNADSTDYIYKTNDNSYKISPLSHGVETKPATLRTLAPDYNDFDYVDIKGSSVDVEAKRSFSFPVAGSEKE